ncbi:MAG: N-acetylmuramoyl-L-alanine amidase [Erythrobacter sp.]|nr:N-acetylmuramoyl-L-alanine amidase [Erythrobacter sp.]
MSFRALLLLVLAVPALLLGAAQALGARIPVPVLGRDYVVRLDLAQAPAPLVLPSVAGSADPALPLVVIDPGHGGRDPGASGGGVREKDLVLAMGLGLRKLLLEAGGIRVAMTREDDRLISLVERMEIARRLEADLFISIHADSAGQSSDVSGASVYTLSNEASSEAAARFAARENSADRLNGVVVEDTSDIVNQVLVELSQGRTQDQSSEFAELIVREGEGRIAFHPSARRSAALAVLRAPDVPAVLFESGFVTSREDRAKLTTEEGRAAYADVLARAIRVYLARRSDVEALDTARIGSTSGRGASLAGAR